MIFISAFVLLYVSFLGLAIFAFDFVFLLLHSEPSIELVFGFLIFFVVFSNGLAFIASKRIEGVFSNAR